MQVISNYPWYYFLICLPVGLIFSGILYYKNKKNVEKNSALLISLSLLRFLSVSLIVFLLLEVFIKYLINETEKPTIIIAQDNSNSVIAGKDSLDIKSNYVKALNDLVAKVKEKYDVKIYQFDSESKPTETFDFKGKETDISKVISDIEKNYSNRNLGAIILATDGIYNKGTNPLYNITKINAPFYTIALGDTTPIRDVWIQSINHNDVVYLGNTLPIEVVVNATDLKNKTINISISNNGKIIKTESININNENYTKIFNYNIEATQAGMQKYTVSLTTIAEDQNIDNNAKSFIIDVIDNRQKILFLANAPHPDIAAIQESINSFQTYEIDVFLMSEFTKSLKPYSLIILHQTNNIPQRILDEIKINSQSALFIGLNLPLNLFNFSVTNSVAKLNDAEPSFNKAFTLFNLSNELKTDLKEWPAVKANYTPINISNNSNVLLNQKIGVIDTENPLFVFTENNGVKVAGFFGDGIWRWKISDYYNHENHELFNELINKVVQYLSVKADKSFFRIFTKKVMNENESLDFTAEVYNQSYELTTDQDVTITLKDENNKSYNYTFSKKQAMYSLSAGQFPAGEYKYEAKTKLGDKVYSKSGVVIIKEMVAEKMNTLANHRILYQIANESGGKMFYKNELQQLQKEILQSENIKSITYTHKELIDLINLKWIFFLILILFSSEWFLRKRNGSV
ncbi:MAG: hypothetical protein ACK50L_11580 [Bacteroidota bacterium]